jgi:opacity protein-like surface antigen
MKKSLFAAVLATLLPLAAVAAQQAVDPDQDFFDHNGSIVAGKYSQGDLRYVYPKTSLNGLVVPGQQAFVGKLVKHGVAEGTAFVFKAGCTGEAYPVKGRYDPKIPGYVLTGKSPVREKSGCRIVGYTSKSPNARLVFIDIMARDRIISKSKPSDEDYIRQVYETESDPDYMKGFTYPKQ